MQVSKENEVANEEKRRVAIIETEVAKRRKECEEDLVKAEPALVAAKEALNTLNKVRMSRILVSSRLCIPQIITNNNLCSLG